MDATVPLQLAQLLRAPDGATRAAAWDELIANHTRLLLAVARSFGGAHDDTMDRYSYILEGLRDADFHRLRSFQPNRGASFSTWLTVAARRLCLDYHRARYGRHRLTGDADSSAPERSDRRTLADSLTVQLDSELLADAEALSADALAVRRERDAGLRAALRALSPRERFLLTLRFQDELSASRIARMLGMPTPFHAYRQLNNVLARLRVALEARGIDGSDG
jgi:RNA polymerase sigma factor (sigma-70 family)